MLAIGSGRIGLALGRAAAEKELPYRVIDRTSGWELLDETAGEPILVLTRNDDLAGVLDRVPTDRLSDLVFVQNGALREFLASRYLPHATRGVLFFAVADRTSAPLVGGFSPFCGHHAGYVTEWLNQAGLPSKGMDWARFSLYELEKMVWISAFGALGDAYDKDVGTLAEQHPGEIAVLADELRTVGRAVMGVDIELDWLVNRMCTYSSKIPRFRAGVREFTWRNGWFVQKATEWGLGQALHIELLKKGGNWPG